MSEAVAELINSSQILLSKRFIAVRALLKNLPVRFSLLLHMFLSFSEKGM